MGWYEKNRDRAIAVSKQYYRDHKEAVLVYYKKRYKQKREELLAYQKQYNRERGKTGAQRKKELREANPGKYRLLMLQHKHRQRANGRYACDGTVSVKALRELFSEFTYCPYCGVELLADNRSLDHKTPLSKGGLHTISNLIPCCFKCNSKKGAMPYDQWMQIVNQ